MELGAMAALPAQQKSAFFQDTRTRPSRLEPSTLRSARSWAFCFFSFLNLIIFFRLAQVNLPLSLSHSGRCADSSLRSLEVFCRCTLFIQKDIQDIESSSSIPEESVFLLFVFALADSLEHRDFPCIFCLSLSWICFRFREYNNQCV